MTTRPAVLLIALGALVGCGDPGDGDADRVPSADTSPIPSPGPAQGAAAGAASGVASAAGIDPDEVCADLDNSYRCAQAVEERVLTVSPRAERRGDTLLLALADGDTLRLGDRPGESGGVRLLSFQDHWPDAGYFVVHEQHYEGSRFLLVDDSTGDRTQLPERPLRSPDGARFAVLSLDLVAGYGPNVVQIWTLGDGAPRVEWEHDPDEWGPADGRWTGPETLMFTRACGPRTGPECGTEMRVRRAGGSWTLEAAGGGDG